MRLESTPTKGDEQARSPAIPIVAQSRPQMEPFYHPKHLPAAAAASPSQLSTTPTTDPSQSLPNSLRQGSAAAELAENKDAEKTTEEPRTPHSRAKNLTRFFPVTKEAPVINSDVNFSSRLRKGEILRFCFSRHPV